MSDTPNARTLHAYAAEWRGWCAWCELHDIDPVHCAVDDLALCWWCGLNRSPLEALRVADLSNGRLRRLSDEARRWTLEWLQAAKIVTGPLFRPIITRRLSGRGRPATELVENDPLTGHGIRDVIDARCVAIGKAKGMFSVSSLRAGRITHEIRRGTDVRDIMGLARVHTLDTVVRRTGPKREARTA